MPLLLKTLLPSPNPIIWQVLCQILPTISRILLPNLRRQRALGYPTANTFGGCACCSKRCSSLSTTTSETDLPGADSEAGRPAQYGVRRLVAAVALATA